VSGQEDVFRTALKEVAVILKQSGIPFALAGGYAVYARGGPENYNDVDFVIREHDASQARELLIAEGLRVDQPPEDWLFKAYTGDTVVDVIYRLASGPVDDALLERCDEMPVESVVMPVLASTDLVIARVSAISEHACDFEPALRTVRALREQVDWQQVTSAFQGEPFGETFLYLVDALGLVPAGNSRADHVRGIA
jgi:hypothetical protein